MFEPMKLLIAYDGSSYADAALDDLWRCGLPRRAEVVIMSVADVFLPPPSSPETTFPTQVPAAVQQAWAHAYRAVEEAQTLAQRAQARVLTDCPTQNVHIEACADSPAWAVIKKADAWQPDLVVVGSRGLSAIGRMLLGSVSHKILMEARCSVRVGLRPRQTNEPSARLLIGVDGSPDAAAAVHAVVRREWPTGSAIHLVAVLDARMRTALAPTRPPVAAWATAGDAEAQSWVPRIVEAMAEPLCARGLTVSSIITAGDPKQVLLDEAEHWGADCIFVGAQGQGRIARSLLGGVAAAVAARAHCSVEVVRPRWAL